jgi:hypothetical protein
MGLDELATLREMIRQAMRLNPAVYELVQLSPQGIYYALTVVALASISGASGQSVVLLVNRVRPRRFVLAVGISTVSQMVGFLLWSITVWGVSTYMFGATEQFVAVAAAVGLAYAPQLLAFFELVPFLGNAFAVLLTLWSMLAIVIAVRVGTGIEWWQAIVTSGLGWLLILLFRRSIGRPVYALGHWVERRVAGNPLAFSMKDVPQLRHASDIFQNLEQWRDRVSQTGLVEIRQRLEEMGKALDRSGGGSADTTTFDASESTDLSESATGPDRIGAGRTGDERPNAGDE